MAAPTAIIIVKDNGIGFAMNEAEQLGRAFRRLHEGEVEGTGLGLSIVRRILARHRGTVWAEGAPNQGATFYFALPKMAADAAADEMRQAA